MHFWSQRHPERHYHNISHCANQTYLYELNLFSSKWEFEFGDGDDYGSWKYVFWENAASVLFQYHSFFYSFLNISLPSAFRFPKSPVLIYFTKLKPKKLNQACIPISPAMHVARLRLQIKSNQSRLRPKISLKRRFYTLDNVLIGKRILKNIKR